MCWIFITKRCNKSQKIKKRSSWASDYWTMIVEIISKSIMVRIWPKKIMKIGIIMIAKIRSVYILILLFNSFNNTREDTKNKIPFLKGQLCKKFSNSLQAPGKLNGVVSTFDEFARYLRNSGNFFPCDTQKVKTFHT